MRYVAELYSFKDGERRSIDTADIEADTDTQAGHKAEEWAIPYLAGTIERAVHLQVAIAGRGVFSKNYGEL